MGVRYGSPREEPGATALTRPPVFPARRRFPPRVGDGPRPPLAAVTVRRAPQVLVVLVCAWSSVQDGHHCPLPHQQLQPGQLGGLADKASTKHGLLISRLPPGIKGWRPTTSCHGHSLARAASPCRPHVWLVLSRGWTPLPPPTKPAAEARGSSEGLRTQLPRNMFIMTQASGAHLLKLPVWLPSRSHQPRTATFGPSTATHTCPAVITIATTTTTPAATLYHPVLPIESPTPDAAYILLVFAFLKTIIMI